MAEYHRRRPVEDKEQRRIAVVSARMNSRDLLDILIALGTAKEASTGNGVNTVSLSA